MTTLYGISNCDSVRKARKWLTALDVDYEYHDFRADGITSKTVNNWLTRVTLTELVNKRSTSWKQLDDTARKIIDDAIETGIASPAIEVLIAHPTLIKRPVLAYADSIQLGFKENTYRDLYESQNL